MTLEVSRADDAGRRLVVARGEVDLDTSPQLLAEVQRAMGGAREVVVDLAGVDYIDSSGVATLIRGLKEAGRSGARFALRDPSPKVERVLELAQLQALFTIERSGGGA